MAAEGEEKEKMVMLRSEDGVDFVLSEAEAEAEALFGRKIRIMMKYESEKHVIPSDDGGEIRYCLIRLSVRGDTLSKVMDYSRTHASGSHDLSDWDADFIAGFNHEALFDLILASEYLQIRGLIDLACQTVASKIKGKSPREICNIFNIKSVFAPELDGDTIAKRLQDSTTCSSDKELPCSETPCLMQELEWEEKALQALDIVRCQEFTGYDPKVNAYIRTRFDIFNLAFFDLDKQSDFCRGPRLNMIPSPIRNSIVGSCVNVITLKVKESEVGFPIKVFGTVVARDQVDYRCVYLFRRERDDPQLITSADDKLTLMDPCRALVPADRIYFEINLMIVCDGGDVKDFSKGVIVFNRARLPNDKLTMGVSLNSYLSRVEVRCAYIVCPIEATIEVNILKGPCSVSRVVAATTKNYEYGIELYNGGEAAAEVETGTVPLSRHVVAVPLGRKLVLIVTGRSIGDVFDQNIITSFGRSTELTHYKLGSALVEVKLVWTAVPRREIQDMIKVVGDESLLM
ncbi:uncharacterized protein LOC123399740 [Hordeum vulgare subsp. vulgare]|uniref:SKP1-like protein n=1 Tax=Hordeum vulgare subsp. vulgare TaxID=112509 RepID=A0A8I6Y036_HORVV|nr:uncharacterized protein LOC123399740 [Hordeum vulgare subsp. vulgare]